MSIMNLSSHRSRVAGVGGARSAGRLLNTSCRRRGREESGDKLNWGHSLGKRKLQGMVMELHSLSEVQSKPSLVHVTKEGCKGAALPK
jgi:hypothetical protein